MSDVLGMSDEDFLKQTPPDTVSEAPSEDPAVSAPAASADANVDTPPATETPQASETAEAPTQVAEASGSDAGSTASTDSHQAADPAGSQEPEAKAATQDQAAAPDYEGFYKQIMAPFKANGKMIELRSPQEAIQLMQMGANYTRKMQELVPHRKVLLMLENNGLLDEGKLSFLIDVEKKNPEAIKKLIKEAGIDPLEIDTSSEPAYREGNHRVSDEEASFRTALDELQSNPAGIETLQTIHTGWDQASKEVLWKSPEILQIIHQQRENGIYDRITTEMHRQKTLGMISPETPFLHAYKHVGDQLVAANAFADIQDNSASFAPSQGGQAPPVVATRVAAPRPAVANNDKASAASPTRAVASKAKEFVNPLAMSDDDFLKQMANRL